MNGNQTPFGDLASAVESSWAKLAHDLPEFTKVATEHLSRVAPTIDLNQFHTQLTNWLVSDLNIPEQVNVHNTFGQPPITVFNDGRFVVDIYIWRGCDTSIHSHGFRGAFKVLYGRSLHEMFEVKTETVIAKDVSLTALGRPRLELLTAGDVRTIHPDQALTHRVIHLDNPTITLCVKTINEPDISQWHHFESGVAIKKRHTDPRLLKKAYYYQYLMETEEALATSFLKKWMEPLDLSTRMNLCEDLSMGACDLPESSVQNILESACEGFETKEWFQRFQRSTLASTEEIVIEQDLPAEIRLAVHFANTGWKYSDVKSWIEKTQSQPISKEELNRRVLGNLDAAHPAWKTQKRRWTGFME